MWTVLPFGGFMKLSWIRLNASMAMLAVLMSAASAVTNSSRLAALDSSQNFYISTGVWTSSVSLAPKIRTVKRASSGTIGWAKDYSYSSSRDNRPVQIQLDGSGNVYVAGYAVNSSFQAAFFLLKYSSTGALTWSKTYGSGTLASGEATGLAIDSSGNLYLTGHYSSAGSVLSKILKYNSSGTLLIDKTFNPQAYSELDRIKIDSSNRIFVSGIVSTGFSSGTSSAVARYDTSLNQIWQTFTSVPDGSANTGLALDSSSNTATSYHYYDTTNNVYIASVEKHALASGTLAWNTTISTNSSDAGAGVICDSSDDMIVGGAEGQLISGFWDSFAYRIAKLSGSTGSITWNSAHAIDHYSSLEVTALAQQASGDYILIGDYTRTATDLVHEIRAPLFDTSGTDIGYWYMDPNDLNYGLAVVPSTTSGTYYFGGTTEGNTTGIDYPLQAKINLNTFTWLWYQTAATP